MTSISRKTCRLLGCCHLLKQEKTVTHNSHLSFTQRRLRHEGWGEVREEKQGPQKSCPTQKSSPNNNLLLQLLNLNKQMVNNKDPFYVMDHFMNNILYEDENMVAFNKPMGLPLTYNPPKSLRNSDMTEPVVNLDGLLPELAKRLFCSKLYVSLPVDRMCSGVIILTKSEKYNQYLRKRFFSLKVTDQLPYQHWEVLCVGIPDKLSKEKEKLYYSKEKYKDIYLPQTVFCKPSKNDRKKGQVYSTTLCGEVIGRNEEKGVRSSHVRVSVTSATNHVIPAYLSERFAPVLGDQEYFWRAVTVGRQNVMILKQIPSAGIPRPQELSKGILQNLEINQGHVQNLPPFLHRSAVDIVHLKKAKKEPFTIQTPLPDFFLVTKYRLLRDQRSRTEFSERFSYVSKKAGPSKEERNSDKVNTEGWEGNLTERNEKILE
ncbi:mitochondrial mRNA pseudouridine synthase Rpusd3-like isoform X2 [Saccostrea cucullata]